MTSVKVVINQELENEYLVSENESESFYKIIYKIFIPCELKVTIYSQGSLCKNFLLEVIHYALGKEPNFYILLDPEFDLE